jgi:deoxycytidylate deaminase
MDGKGGLVSVGSNEVPKYGGGSYDETSENDDRCFRIRKKCSNTVEQELIIEQIFKQLKDSGLLSDTAKVDNLSEALKTTRVKALIEFSRSIHAEMDALLGLVRSGTKLPDGSVLFSTTYRYPFRKQRCLIAADGFYEPKATGEKRKPHTTSAVRTGNPSIWRGSGAGGKGKRTLSIPAPSSPRLPMR